MNYYKTSTDELYWTKASKEADKVTVWAWNRGEWVLRGIYGKQDIKNAVAEKTLKPIKHKDAYRITLRADYKKYSQIQRVKAKQGENNE